MTISRVPARRVAAVAVLLAGLALLTACEKRVHGSGTLATEQRNVASFDEIRVSGVIELKASIGQTQSVSVSGDDNIVPLIRTNVRDGKLQIGSSKPYDSNVQRVTVTVTVPRLTEVEGSGATTSTISGLNGGDLTVVTSGAATITATGSVDRLDAEASGASRLSLNGLAAKSVKAETSGASNIEVQATESLTAEASGASSITYSGAATQISTDTSGVGKVNKR